MTDPQNFGFAKLVPGFDFLQNLATGGTSAGLPQMPNLSHWVAPTLDLEELEKRIQELKAVQFWLEQNSKILAATVQALEVQKMTLATLKGMNYQMADLAEAMKVPPQAAGAAGSRTDQGADEPAPAPKPAAARPRRGAKAASSASAKSDADAAGVVDPMQWWGSLTQQFQHIASQAMKDVAQQGAAAASAAAGAAGAAGKAAGPRPANGAGTGAAKSGTSKSTPKRAARKPAAPRPQARTRR